MTIKIQIQFIIIFLLFFVVGVFTIVFFHRNDDVYLKLAQQKDISILVVGDSIGRSSCASKADKEFVNLLKTYLQHKYSITVTVLNVSMGGNDSYAEFIRVSQIPVNRNFDLVILCCGQNDIDNSVGRYYEALIRRVKTKWPNCNLISILQSSQRSYTKKIKTIQTLAKHYDILIADTIEPFTSGENGKYSTLTDDGVHPNDKGYAVYAKVLQDIIDSEVIKRDNILLPIKKKKLPKAIFSESLEYSIFHEIPTNIFVKNENEYCVTLFIPKKSHIGIDVDHLKGSNYYELIVNDKSRYLYQQFSPWMTQRHILEMFNIVASGTYDLKIKFKYKEQIESFKGLFITSSEGEK